MVNWTKIIEAFVTTVLISYLIIPLLRKVAFKTNYLDHPKNTKVHAHPMPLLGGVAIYIAFVIGIYMTLGIDHDHKLTSILMGATLLLIVGLVDDRMGMMPEVKLLAQFLAAMVVIKSGVRMEFLPNYYLNVFLTYLWLVGITNAFNLLDNMNGLSAGIAAIAAIFFGIAMWTTNQIGIAIIAFALAGSTLGFLRHNFPKAHVFMGDSGSLVIGYLLASTAVMGSWNTKFLTTSLAMPIIILAYPIFDTTLVTVMRLIEGRSIFQGGRDHSSHRLALLGLKRKRAVLLIYLICISLGFAALLIQRLPIRAAISMIVLVAVFMVIFGIRLAMVDTGRFGRTKERYDDIE